MFASLNACRGFNKSRRDDIEAAFYILIYFINHQKLPWSDFSENLSNLQFQDLVRLRLKRVYTAQLFKMIPLDLQKCL